MLLLALTVLACSQEEEITYNQFNWGDDKLTIYVGMQEKLPSAAIDLHSTTGLRIVGSAEVDPGGGPIDTLHTITVEVGDEWEDMVTRASVRTSSSSRGEDEYDMVPDSADEGLYQLSLVSVGIAGESREDIFTIRLWQEGESTMFDTGAQ